MVRLGGSELSLLLIERFNAKIALIGIQILDVCRIKLCLEVTQGF